MSRWAKPDEVQAYKQMVMDVAEKEASMFREGGFLGSGDVRLSDAEQSFVDEVKGARQLT